MAYVLILGATSDIGGFVAREYARRGYDLYLAARDPRKLEPLSLELSASWAVKVDRRPFDARKVEEHERFFASLEPEPEGVICLVGALARGSEGPADLEDLREVVEVNFLGCAAILEIVADAFQAKSRGFIVGVSSVAGDRGRGSNYPYGSAKAGFTAYLSGLRQRLHPHGVQVLTVKPGFVRTRMTEAKELPPLLTTDPEEAARSMARAQETGRNHAYISWLWRPVMLVIRLLPEWLFKRLPL